MFQPNLEMKTKVLESIKQYILDNGYPPTIRELCGITGLKSTSTVYMYLGKLEKDGNIEIKKNAFRALKVVG